MQGKKKDVTKKPNQPAILYVKMNHETFVI